MKPGPAISGFLTQIVKLEPADNFRGDFARRLAESFA